MYYSYQIHARNGVWSLLLNSCRLFQQYLVDAYACIELSRLDFYEHNQSQLRSAYVSGIYDALSRGDTESRSVGKRVFLPPSFVGGPRYMYSHYQDALSICREYGNPQYFITFTCNVGWPEITRYMNSHHQTDVGSRADIISRVFHMKVPAFIAYLKSDKTFGPVSACKFLSNLCLADLYNNCVFFYSNIYIYIYVYFFVDLYTIEFQKRGLPHCHILIWVEDSHKIKDPSKVDDYITAELPDPVSEPLLYEIVTRCMVHGPCGLLNSKAPCMKDGNCKKKFPKSFVSATFFDRDGYAHYKRNSSSLHMLQSGIQIDNRYIVPYNKRLSSRFNAHINVEYCGWNMMIKYLFKYVSKGMEGSDLLFRKILNVLIRLSLDNV